MPKIREDMVEEILVELEMYLEDNPEEAVEYANIHGLDWAHCYSGIYDLCHECFCDDLVEFACAIRESDCYIDTWQDYCFVDDEIHEASYREEIAERHSDVIADIVLNWYRNDITDDFSEEILAILNKGHIVPVDDMLVECRQKFVDYVVGLPSSSGDDVYAIIESCKKIFYANEVLEYLEKTKFCGADDETLDAIRSEERDKPFVVTVAEDYISNKCGSMVSVQKYTEMAIDTYNRRCLK